MQNITESSDSDTFLPYTQTTTVKRYLGAITKRDIQPKGFDMEVN